MLRKVRPDLVQAGRSRGKMSQIFTTQFSLGPALLKHSVSEPFQHVLSPSLKHELLDLVSRHIEGCDFPL